MIEALAIGDELLDGRVVDGNSAVLARALRALGLRLGRVTVVGDDEEAIAAALAASAARGSVVVCSGGLGPTGDDRTREAAARWLGVGLEEDAGSLEAIRRRFEASGRVMSPNNRQQARFPAGSAVLENPAGTAPGFCCARGEASAWFLPGVPHEYAALLERHVLPALAPASGATARRRLVFFGIGESELEHRLAGVGLPGSVSLGWRPRFPELEVTVVARGADAAAAEGDAELARALILDRARPWCVAEGAEELPERVGRLLLARGERATTVESCTGGMIAAAITSVAGSSAWFDEARVTYANAAKASLAGVREETLAAHGAVSAAVVQEMALGGQARSGAAWSVAVSGIAGPGGGSADKPVGLVYLAIAGPGGVEVQRLLWPPTWSRERIRQATCWAALAGLAEAVEAAGGEED